MPMSQKWVWYSSSCWPGFDPAAHDNLCTGGNGLALDPQALVCPAPEAECHWLGGRVAGADFGRYPKEVGLFANSTVVMDGMVFGGLRLEVTLFTDGTWGAVLLDDALPHVGAERLGAVVLDGYDSRDYCASLPRAEAQFVCYTAGTLIETPSGPRRVEMLKHGDQVLTVDHGAQQIRWTGRRKVLGRGASAPIVIDAGALGNSAAVVVSPTHRIVLDGPMVSLIFGVEQVLVEAQHLVNGTTVRQMGFAEVDYVHFVCDRHEIVALHGLLSESLLPSKETLEVLPRRDRNRLLRAVPELRHGFAAYGPAARMCLTGEEAAVLLAATGHRTPAQAKGQRVALA